MAPPNAAVRRAFTSTKTSTWPSSATKSSSPTDERRLRATIRYPLCRKYCSAADSPSRPKSLRGSRMVTDSSVKIRPSQHATGATYHYFHSRGVRPERTCADESRRGHVERVVASALPSHTLYGRENYNRDRSDGTPPSCDRA